MNYAAAQSPYWPTPSPQFHIYKEWINDNGCMDPCAQGPFLWPPAIFRSLSDLQIVSHKEIQSLTQSAAQSEFYSFYLIAGSVVGCFVLAQGLWAICFGRKSPRQCRTVIYKFVNDAKMPRSKFHQRHRSVSRYGCILQKMSAKYLAIFAYLWTVISSIICVVLFVFNIIAMELLLSDLPQSESATHVGAWSPWAATGLIFAAALISKIPSNPIRKMFNSSCQAVRIICHWIRSGVIPVRDIISRPGIQNSGPLAPTESKTPGRVRTAKMHPLSALSKKFERNLASCRNTLTEEWESLVGFWRDPDCTETAMA
ncbi:hypothetical protein IMSHALPRED_003962 [Imshaugia aleurites]|uniref:Uncharacterized protein n=1 Tax=Imshaugia aleurites TaxID=172621 RepID=A0A8H3I5Q5_9LECA|nr:hypothetical protein IMSHALPRED_003962 [Imshaugia aleurites]